MTLGNTIVTSHKTVMERARNMDARFYDTMQRASYGGVALSGLGAAVLSPACGVLAVAFVTVAIHYGHKSNETMQPDYIPSSGSIKKSRSFDFAGS